MKESNLITKLTKKVNGRASTKLSGLSSNKSNGTITSNKEHINKTAKTKMGNGNSITKTSLLTKNKSPKSANKQASELRPRRRASQTYFFKYQLARNPLKAEEEDLKLALLASLQHCNGNGYNANANGNKDARGDCKALPNNHKVAIKIEVPSKDVASSGNSINPTNNRVTNGNGTISKEAEPNSCRTGSKGKKVKSSDKQPQTTSDKKAKLLTSSFAKPSPEQEYLNKYKPETEDFLTFICFRSTAPNFQKHTEVSKTPMDVLEDFDSNHNTNNNVIAKQNNGNNRISTEGTPIELLNNLKQSPSSKLMNNNDIIIADNISNIHINCSSQIINNDLLSPNQRRPVRQSPRLANSTKKISENDNLNNVTSATNTAYDNPINYEEDVKRASIALEDMAHEINSSDEIAQNSKDCISRILSPPYRNNKHIVKGLMTREFAGAFADEETIFESISNHKI